MKLWRYSHRLTVSCMYNSKLAGRTYGSLPLAKFHIYPYKRFFEPLENAVWRRTTTTAITTTTRRIWLKIEVGHSAHHDFSFSVVQWFQASLPVRGGGLGVTCMSSLALPDFSTSARSIVSLQDEILANCLVAEGSFFEDYLLHWLKSFGHVPSPFPQKQTFVDHLGIRLKLNRK